MTCMTGEEYWRAAAHTMKAERDMARAELAAELANANDAADKWRDLFVSNEKDNKRLRAELAEARADHATAYANTVALAQECARLRAELDEMTSMHKHSTQSARDFWQRCENAEAAIARVRELVRGRWVSVDDLQRAIEGNQP